MFNNGHLLNMCASPIPNKHHLLSIHQMKMFMNAHLLSRSLFSPEKMPSSHLTHVPWF